MSKTLRGRLRSALLDNLGLKILALICSLGFFAFTHGAERAQRTFRVSVVSVMPPESANRELMTQLPTEITITLLGSRTQLDAMRPEELGSVQLDLRTGQETSIQIEPEMVNVPPGMSVEHIYPPKVELRWDDVVVRQVPVQVARTGVPAEGYTVKGQTSVEPDVVTARGPHSIIDVLQYARTVPFDVSGLKDGSYSRPLALNPPPELAKFDVQNVTATVEVGRELRTVPFQKKVEVVGAPSAVTTPSEVTVTVSGPTEFISELDPESIIVRVELPADVDLKKENSFYMPALVDIPGATEIKIEPPKVLVKWRGK